MEFAPAGTKCFGMLWNLRGRLRLRATDRSRFPSTCRRRASAASTAVGPAADAAGWGSTIDQSAQTSAFEYEAKELLHTANINWTWGWKCTETLMAVAYSINSFSTYMPLLLLQEFITKSIEKGNLDIALYVDLKKAFDTVDHDIYY